MSLNGTWVSRRISKEAHLGQSISHNRFLVKDYIHKFYYIIMINQAAYLRHATHFLRVQ